MTPIHHRNHLQYHRGFTLIEVLVAVVVLSIGLLGLASLQATGLKQNHSALARSQATILAYDIIDRMRANRMDALNDKYLIAMNNGNPEAGTLPKDDLIQWRAKIADVLTNAGNGSVARSGDKFVIVVQWNDARAEGSENAVIKSVTVETQL